MPSNSQSSFSALTITLTVLVSLLCGVLRAQQETPNRYQISKRAAAIHQRGYVFDGHNDLPWEVRTKTTKLFDELDISKSQPKLHTDIARLRQ
ncbi:MAG: hypothetical protein ACKOAH_15865 [Pirellula sp.]